MLVSVCDVWMNYGGNVNNGTLYDSCGGVHNFSFGVRPVVSLKAEIELKEGTDGSYDIVK